MNAAGLFSDDISFLKSPGWKKYLGIALLLLQLLLVVWARFIPERYFCWAPHDCQTEYELKVFVNGRELTDDEIQQRYHRPRIDRDVRSSNNVKGRIIQQARTYGRHDKIHVIMHYRVNGIPQEPWVWQHNPNNQ